LDNRVSPARGVVLRPEEFARSASFDVAPPAERWAPWVERYWSVAWSLPPGVRHVSSLAPVPSINLTYEYGGLRRAGVSEPGWYLTGPVTTSRFDVEQRGVGRVVGIKFRPGGLAALTGWSTVPLRDVVRRAEPMLGADAGWCPEAPASALAGALDELLARLFASPADDPAYDRLRAALAVMADEPALSISEVAVRVGLGLRSLQRLFAHYVGVGPKWMLVRARLHAVIDRLDAGYGGTLADLAAELGFFDQAHLVRDFAALVGVPPGEYRARPR